MASRRRDARRAIAEGLVEALSDVPVRRALVARAEEARDVAARRFARPRRRGGCPGAVRWTVVETLDAQQIESVRGVDYLTFTSSSTVRNFLAAAGGPEVWREGDRPRLASIGPVTSGTLREHGLEPDVEATHHHIDGLIEALVADAGAR